MRYAAIKSDLIAAFNWNFNPEQLSKGLGWYFPALVSDTGRYIRRASPRLVDWLRLLRAQQRRLFLLTNSHSDYTELLMRFAFGSAWRDLFDIVIVKGGKPSFFAENRETRPFLRLVNAFGNEEGAATTTLEPKGTYV